MRVIFFGTPVFAANILKYLLEHQVNIVAVVSRPDKPQGRSQKLAPTPVKEMAATLRPDLPIFQPVRASSEEFVKTLEAFKPDLFIVVAYGEILRQRVLDVPTLMPINVHASLLPKYRGAAPIQRTLMEGESVGGVTIMEMVLEMDAGDILHVEKMEIPPSMNYYEYSERLCELSCAALMKVLQDFQSGGVNKKPQDPAGVTFAPKISSSDCQIDWSKGALTLHNQIRALAPKPGAYAEIDENGQSKRLKIVKARALEEFSGQPKEILSYGNHFIVGCGQGALEILELQPEGKRVMSAQDYARGFAQPVFK